MKLDQEEFDRRVAHKVSEKLSAEHRMARIETRLEFLFGNGGGGILDRHDTAISRLKIALGTAIGGGFILLMVVQIFGPQIAAALWG